MFVTIVDVVVKADHIDDFIEACRLNHEASVMEQGNRRFDILQSEENPQQFVLYEAYGSEDDAREHKKTAHYLNWRETVADWMERPRQGMSYRGHFPA